MISNVLVHRLREIINSPKLDKFKSDKFEELLPIYQNLELENWNAKNDRGYMGNMGMYQDRTGTLPHYLKMREIEPLPPVEASFQKSFETICLETAQEIVKKANGRKINISWSGGLDSTTAFFSLREFAEPNQLKIFCNYNSIVESGSLFDEYINGQVEYSLTTSLTHPEFGDGLIVTGYLGDQLFGRYQVLAPEEFNMPWRDYLRPDQVEFMEGLMANFPGDPIVTVPDYLSFNEINGKWMMGKTNRMRNMEKSIADRIVNFYETIDFQKWSLGRYEEKLLNDDPKTYKYPMRVLLKKLMKSTAYADNKIVQTSHYHILQHDWVMLLEDGTNLYVKDFV